MHIIRRQRLILILAVILILSLGIGLALYALRQNIDLFFTPTQVDAGQAPLNHEIRVGGWVQKGSVQHSDQRLEVKFIIIDNKKKLTVIYTGILPDLFREGQAVVVQGQLKGHLLIADQVLAKHDENYTPPVLKN